MVDSRQKGARAEYLVRDLLREKTGIQYERVPMSGALSYLKGDIYAPPNTGKLSNYCIEVKSYKDEHFNSNILKPTNTKSQLEKWLIQTEREAEEMSTKPMLIFKKDRSPFFVAILEDDDICRKLSEVYPYSVIKVSAEVGTYRVMDFKLFLKVVDAGDLCK